MNKNKGKNPEYIGRFKMPEIYRVNTNEFMDLEKLDEIAIYATIHALKGENYDSRVVIGGKGLSMVLQELEYVNKLNESLRRELSECREELAQYDQSERESEWDD